MPPSQAAEGDSSLLNLSSLLEEAVLQLRKDVPLELVVNMFQKLVRGVFRLHEKTLLLTLDPQNLRHILFSEGGKLTGMVTKTDVVWLLTAQASHAGALAEDRR